MQRIYDLTQYYTRYGAGAHAVAGVNIALWDIAGKAYGQPIYRLFGAEQRQVRAYASVLFQDTPADTYELAARLADRGFTAAKFGWGPDGAERGQRHRPRARGAARPGRRRGPDG